MEKDTVIRWGWLKFMYAYTIVVAGGFGLAIIFFPSIASTLFGWPVAEPIAMGIVGSVYLAFGILSIFGLQDPLRFAPVLILQLVYKVLWFVGVIVPLLLNGRYPSYATLTVALFSTFVVGDLIAIPFPAIFSKKVVVKSQLL